MFFRRLKKKKGHNVGVVATARKLIVIAWHMLNNNEPYRYAVPSTTETKLRKVRLATGHRHMKGFPKGTPRSPNWGTGQQPMRTIPALPKLYEREGLPPIAPAPGEERAIKEMKLKSFVRSISKERK